MTVPALPLSGKPLPISVLGSLLCKIRLGLDQWSPPKGLAGLSLVDSELFNDRDLGSFSPGDSASVCLGRVI